MPEQIKQEKSKDKDSKQKEPTLQDYEKDLHTAKLHKADLTRQLARADDDVLEAERQLEMFKRANPDVDDLALDQQEQESNA